MSIQDLFGLIRQQDERENGAAMLRSYDNYIYINIIVWDKLAFAVGSVQLALGERKQGLYSKRKQTSTNLTPDDATFVGSGNRFGNLKPIIYKGDSGRLRVSFITDVFVTHD